MQELPKLHRNYSSEAIIWVLDHPTEENILLLKNITMYNYTPVLLGITEVTTEHQKWPKISTNSMKSFGRKQKPFVGAKSKPA